MYQWIYSNLKLQKSFKTQAAMAENEIKDRFMQVYTLQEQNFMLQKLLSAHSVVSAVDMSLESQHSVLSEIMEMWS